MAVRDSCAARIGRTAQDHAPAAADASDMDTVDTTNEAVAAETGSPEEQRVRHWRFEQFRHLGFGLVTAAMMADTKIIDLEAARNLVASGCPVETASRILL